MPKKLTYHPNLYLGNDIDTQKLGKLKKKLENHPLITNVFLIALSRNPSDQLEIYDAKLLAQSYYRKNPPYIIGIAGNREDAFGLVEEIVRDCLEARGDCALKEYLRC